MRMILDQDTSHRHPESTILVKRAKLDGGTENQGEQVRDENDDQWTDDPYPHEMTETLVTAKCAHDAVQLRNRREAKCGALHAGKTL